MDLFIHKLVILFCVFALMFLPENIYSQRTAGGGRQPVSGQGVQGRGSSQVSTSSSGSSQGRTTSGSSRTVNTASERSSGVSSSGGRTTNRTVQGNSAVRQQTTTTRVQTASNNNRTSGNSGSNRATGGNGTTTRKEVRSVPASGQHAVLHGVPPAPYYTDRYGNEYRVERPQKTMPGRPFRMPEYTVGACVNRVPAAAVSLVFGDSRYFFCEGVFFRPVGATFEVCRPPVGMMVDHLPTYMVVASMSVPVEAWNPTTGHLVRYAKKENVYYHDGVFYVKESAQNRYRVIPPLKGAWVSYLPPDRMHLVVGNQLFFRVGDTYYLHRRVSGEDWFVVVGDRPVSSVYTDF